MLGQVSGSPSPVPGQCGAAFNPFPLDERKPFQSRQRAPGTPFSGSTKGQERFPYAGPDKGLLSFPFRPRESGGCWSLLCQGGGQGPGQCWARSAGQVLVQECWPRAIPSGPGKAPGKGRK